MYHTVLIQKQKKNPRKSRKKGIKNREFEEHLTKYDVVGELGKAPPGLSIGQLWRGDAVKAEKDLQRVLAGMKVNMVVRVVVAKASNQNQISKLCPVQVYWLKRSTLLDTEATPNVISTGLLKKIGVRAKHTMRGNTVASGDHMNWKCIMKDDPIRFDNVSTTMESFAVEVPVDLLIGINELERLQTNLDLYGHFV